MAFWDQLKAKATELNGQLQTKTVQFKNKEFANGSMAMCALIAAADGSIDPAERQKTAALISGNEALKVFPAEELRQKFDWYCDKLAGDFDFGKVEATATIAKLKGKPDQGSRGDPDRHHHRRCRWTLRRSRESRCQERVLRRRNRPQRIRTLSSLRS